jgi:hypothetical protein
MTGQVDVYEPGTPDLSELDWNGLVDRGRKIASDAQWTLGDLACQVETHYGESSLESTRTRSASSITRCAATGMSHVRFLNLRHVAHIPGLCTGSWPLRMTGSTWSTVPG